MKMQRKSYHQDSQPNSFIGEIEQSIKKKGLKNAACILLGANDEIEVISAHDDSVQLAGIIDFGKTIFHNDVLENED